MTMMATMAVSALLSLLLLRAVIAVVQPRFITGGRGVHAPAPAAGSLDGAVGATQPALEKK